MKHKKKNKSKIDPIVQMAQKNREKSELVQEDKIEKLKPSERKQIEIMKEENERVERENLFKDMQRHYN